MLFECKRYASAVKREDVQVLKDKLRSTGAHKGVVVAASGFQRGALEYVWTHRIACVRLVDDQRVPGDDRRHGRRDESSAMTGRTIRSTAESAIWV
jgi:restriction endonuclease